MHQQLGLLERPRIEDTLYHCITLNGASALRQKFIKMLPHLVIVKTRSMPDTLRHESCIISALHRGRESSTLYIIADLLRCQFTADPRTSWLCMRPVFGPTLFQFGESCSSNGGTGIPGWMVAHICLCLIGAVEFLHDDGVCHGNISAANVMLNLYPRYFHHRYRGYPDLQLVDFRQARELDDAGAAEDVRGLLGVMQRVIVEWSDVAAFLGVSVRGDGEGEGDEDALVLLLDKLRGMWSGDAVVGLEDIKRHLVIRMEVMRNTGPEMIPRDLIKLLHADLASEEELEHAMRHPVVMKFGARKDSVKRILENAPVVMGSGGHAGMKTERIVVVRYTTRKAGFLRIVGGGDVEGVDVVEMGGLGEDAEKADV